MTDHPGEQFPSEVDPDVEPGYEPEPDESPEPDYDSEPGAQSTYRPSQHGVPHTDPLLAGFTLYGELPAEPDDTEPEEDTEQVFEASLEAEESPAEEAAEPEEEPQETVIPRPSVPSPASFQPRPPVPSPASFQPRPAVPSPASVQPRPPEPVEERDEDAPHPLVEETMARLDELRERPVAEHAEVYADLHERLQTALVEADAEDRG
ncbi:hypothetical protein EV138_7039 [Kribbella voronezhensis]|uniref:Uncharacterized protein n=1 Tax=Kribbella voronezhensis TaxID=2512212 RepID=A0A4R7SSA7_9ACTN|nr:hypothetical protein [Kribbella voronezhensis]TDU82152.1 hypothetical protein EV138_7039 [Kribbella voronezhensis]